MSADDLVERLLEQLLESDKSVDEVCEAHPELIDQVRDRWRRLRTLQAGLDELFPKVGTGPAAAPTTGLPQVPGYTLEAELGRGGMGVVYRAIHDRLQRTVALKMMLAGPFARTRELARFQREAELVAQLQHPNIVAIYDVGDVDGQPFFTMELVGGKSLAERLRAGPMQPMAAAALMATLARAIDFAHLHGIVHRDLKPANILLATDGTPKVGDFGLARRIDAHDITVSGERIGTPNYMSPEQVSGHAGAVGPPTDVHALGVVLYEMLTGRPPFLGASDAETTQLVLAAEPPAPRSLAVGIPRDLETICLQCLRKEPYRRYASAALLATDLDHFREGLPIAARRVGLPERLWAWARRRPGLATALGLCAILALSHAIVGISAWQQQQRLLADVEIAIASSHAHARAERLDQADEALRQATTRLAGGGSPELQARLATAAADLRTATELDRVRLRQPLELEGKRVVRRGRKRSGSDYSNLLHGIGVDPLQGDVEEVASRIRAKSVAPAIVAALDDWTTEVDDLRQRSQLLAVARAADPDPGGWRDRARDPDHWSDPAALRDLAATADVERLPAAILFTLAERLQAGGADALPLLELAVRHRPQDFWLQLAAGLACSASRLEKAIQYMHAAVALRPDEAAPNSFLGLALCAEGRFAEAEPRLRRAIEIAPGQIGLHANLGSCLMSQRRYSESLAAFRRALAIDPSRIATRVCIGIAHVELGALDAAVEELRAAEALAPEDPQVQGAIGFALLRRGDHDGALARLGIAVRKAPEVAEHHQNIAHALARLGRFEEALSASRRALELDPRSVSVLTVAGSALREAGSIREAIEVMRRACALPEADVVAFTQLGGTLAIDWQFGAAVHAFESALRIAPDHQAALAGRTHALLLEGRFASGHDSAKHFAQIAAGRFEQQARTLLLDTERLIALANASDPDSAGSATGRDCLCFAARSHAAGELDSALRWYAAAFAREPNLENDVRGGARLLAIGVALLAAERSSVTDGGAASLRARANSWLRGDLAFRRRVLGGAPAALRAVTIEYANRMFDDARLASVRDAARLARLPSEEREAWLGYWKDLDAWLRSAQPH